MYIYEYIQYTVTNCACLCIITMHTKCVNWLNSPVVYVSSITLSYVVNKPKLLTMRVCVIFFQMPYVCTYMCDCLNDS